MLNWIVWNRTVSSFNCVQINDLYFLESHEIAYSFNYGLNSTVLQQGLNNPHRLRGVMVKALDCGIVVSEFVLQSRYYVHIRANTLGKGMNPLILPAMG